MKIEIGKIRHPYSNKYQLLLLFNHHGTKQVTLDTDIVMCLINKNDVDKLYSYLTAFSSLNAHEAVKKVSYSFKWPTKNGKCAKFISYRITYFDDKGIEHEVNIT